MRQIPLCSIFNLIISLGFFYLFYIRYWKWRDCINRALSSCLTPDGDSLISGGMFWGVPALFLLLLAAVEFLMAFLRQKRSS